MDVYLGYERWKHTYLRWRHDFTMSSENLQGYLWIPCQFYSSLANQIMCKKKSALEYALLCSWVWFLFFVSLHPKSWQNRYIIFIITKVNKLVHFCPYWFLHLIELINLNDLLINLMMQSSPMKDSKDNVEMYVPMMKYFFYFTTII